MGRLWVTENGKRKRTAEGVAHELKWELSSILLGIFQCSKILGMTFPTVALFEPDGHPPRRSVPPFDVANSTHSTTPIASTECARIPDVLFRGDEAKIRSSVVKPVSVDVVNKYPPILGFPDNSIMHKIRFIASISTVRKIEPFSFIETLPNIFIYLSKTYEFIFVVMEGRLHKRVVDDSLRKNPLSCNRGEDYRTTVSSPLGLSSLLSGYGFIFIWHIWSIPRIQISSNRRALI